MSYGNGQYDGGGQYDSSGPISGNGQYDSGGLWDGVAQGAFWAVGGYRLPVRGVRLTPTTLTLDVALRTPTARRALREFDDDAGAYQDRSRASGEIEHLDTAGGDNTYTVQPAVKHRPPRVVRDWLVEDVSRDRASADTKAVLGSVTLRGRRTRAEVTGHDDADDSGAWEFDFTGGRVVSRRVSRLRQSVGSTTLQIVLSPRQAELIESVAAATAGAVSNAVPDGQAFTRDTSAGDRQTVTVDPPDGVTDPALSAGTYVVSEWSVDGSDGGAYRMDLSVSTRV